jgi:acyl-CoA synthetase (AMP-forming)/AMP-acid ligase II
MGLIGMLLQPIYAGGTCAMMSPIAFLKRPVRWLEAMSHWRAAYTTAPDFAYDLCARVVPTEQVAHLDLSNLRWALNGAEPVRASTITRFSQSFASIGFRLDAFAPCYGMAENTLLASSTRPETSPVFYSADRTALERDEVRPGTPGRDVRMVGCGRADPARVRIVDPRDRAVLGFGQVGEIWLTGPSVAAGYWRRPEITEEIFRAYTADGDGPYLRTGDLGSVVDGELYITGRLKDVVIVHGRNLYPQDIEHVVREIHPALSAGTGVVFGVSDDHEHIVVIHEVKTGLLGGLSLEELAARIKVAVVKCFDVPTPCVVLTNRGVVQRTTSSKVRRGVMCTLFLEQRLAAVHEDVTTAVQALRHRASEPATTA